MFAAIKNLLLEAAHHEQVAASYLKAHDEAMAKCQDLLNKAAVMMENEGVPQINMGEGYIYKISVSKPRASFLPTAVKAFSPVVLAKYFTTPRITQKGLEQAVKDGAIRPEEAAHVIENHATENGGGEISLKKVADKEYMKDVSL